MLDSLYLKMNKSDGNNFIINNYDDVKGSLKYLLNKKKSYLKVQNSVLDL